MDIRHWDEMYRNRARVFSGNPNAVLVAEVAALPPGQALDVGCGEGADTLWLARQGWHVTAIDVSETALRRAAASDRATSAAAATDAAAAIAAGAAAIAASGATGAATIAAAADAAAATATDAAAGGAAVSGAGAAGVATPVAGAASVIAAEGGAVAGAGVAGVVTPVGAADIATVIAAGAEAGGSAVSAACVAGAATDAAAVVDADRARASAAVVADGGETAEGAAGGAAVAAGGVVGAAARVAGVGAAGAAATAVATTTAGNLRHRVAWVRAELGAMPLPAGAFDLVSVQYFPLLRQPGDTVVRSLLDAVAPGGTLLFVTHARSDLAPRPGDGFDPADYHQADTIASLLDSTWTVLVNETRPRSTPAPGGTHHSHDSVLRARRLS
ncbi:class I SAM-dependent methyltransferase [Amycolatopsis saalfeldensis]|uniref:Thiopurine S-methyltransferase (TPMT) n=1 Tax=Amycolatopsis saalfeldensis TaxID=394193 RepID=A0A1H8T730_9PSEU|nr:class I SAM-dependent methyltransferase [Amycolatopsis saalfeldensis]SEO86536.1 Thiopurine S-methyltransferase (TPMT) [Amycolatopsis saalfeldensis]